STGADIYRATCYIPVKGEEELNAFRRLIATPECRPAWDRIVEESEIVEEVDADTRISRTVFKLGWPASPRDAITVSRTLMDSKSLIDVSCSLPRSPDAPVYLRPAPPYVRSHVNLFAWCLERSAYSGKPHVKLTCFWSWDLRGAWIGMPAGGIGARLPSVITSLVQHVKDGDALHVPFLSHYGRNVELTNRTFNSSRDMVTVEYQVVCDDTQDQNKDEARDLQLEWSLPAAEGWDVHVDVKPLDNHKHSSVEWKSAATRAIQSGRQSARMTFNVQHLQSEGPTGRSLLAEGIRGRITVQRIAASQDVKLRINDKPFAVEEVRLTEEEILSPKIDLDLSTGSSSLADDSASISNMSMRSEVSSASATTMGDDVIKRAATPSSIGRPAPDRNTAIASIIRRNYIYFTSLLQEPEAKWKHFSDTRGVTITQLDSIDPTLVVYRAEATFVGVGVWDLFAAIANAGVKNSWDKGAEESRLVEDLGDSSKLWWNKLRGTWPVASRDSVVIETVYKSPSSIHIFSFSSDDKKLFPAIPSPDTGAIRTQIDLRGWSIESLSPTTAHITLIEQSDPKGWTSKSSATPAAMTAAVAGVGDFAIKQGGPPITTRLLGGKIRQMKYEADKSSYRIEYDLAENHSEDLSGNVECEIRCDVETWSPSLDVVVDPPPINVSCLRRHKLSQGGSGLWLTIEQPIASLEDDPSRITVRKANNKEKGVVYVNGARMKVDMDDLKDAEVTQLREQKRTKPKRVPLDLVNESPRRLMIGSASPVGSISRAGTPASANGVSTASSNLAAITSGGANGNATSISAPAEQTTMDVFSDEKPRQPMTCALDVLFLLRRIHAERSPDPAGNPAGWSLVANRNGLYTRRKMMQSISPTVIVQRGDKVVEGLTAEDILSVISNVQCRKVWDERVETTTNLESYGNGASTAFFTTKGSFPFRGRAFSLASLVARSGPRASQFGNPSAPTVYFHASSSYSMSQSTFSAMKLNPTVLPMGKVLIDGWILETLDPYSSTLNYQIPSTRVTHLVAVDYAGSLPVTVNAMWNTQLSRSIAYVEDYLKQQGTLPSLRAPPSCMEVLGDGRDEDHDLIWNLSDDKTKRACTLIYNDFSNATKVYNVLVSLDAASHLVEETSTPLAVPFPRRAALSNASTTRGMANAASMFSSPSSDANLSSPSNAMVEGGTSVDSAPLSRTTSVSSLRSATSRPRPSVIRKETKKPSDLVVLDVEVELRHYERGYDIVLKSMLGDEKAKETEDDDESLPAETPRASGPSEQKEFPSLTSKEDKEKHSGNTVWPLEIPSGDADEVLPLSVSTFDLPPSAVLAATLDPSARPKKHLVRVTLPTAAFMGTARSNPFHGPELEESPAWYDKVRERGALISLELKPRGGGFPRFGSPVSNGSGSFDNPRRTSGSSTPSDSGMSDQGETDSQQVPVYYKGVRISVTHVNKTSAMLQRESDDEQEYAILKRIAPPAPPRAEGQPTPAGMSMHKRKETAETKLEERLPVQLQSPLAKSNKFIRDASENAAEKANGEEQAKKDGNVISPSSSVGDTTIGLTPMANRANQLTPSNSNLANASSSTPTPTTRTANPSTPASAASAQIMSILNSYPLSRLGGGASTAVSTTVANGGLFSKRTDADGDGVNGSTSGTDGEKGKANGDQKGNAGGADDENATTMPGQLIIATEQIRKRIIDIRFTWSTMILVALIAFLLGSLVRSLLEPADFILVNKLKGTTGLRGEGGQAIEAAAVREIKKLFDQGQGPHIGEPNNPHHSVAWRELKRLIELRNLFGGRWDLVIAAVRR
ncbi:Bet v1-like protein, partial [Meira miltonrushii]